MARNLLADNKRYRRHACSEELMGWQQELSGPADTIAWALLGPLALDDCIVLDWQHCSGVLLAVSEPSFLQIMLLLSLLLTPLNGSSKLHFVQQDCRCNEAALCIEALRALGEGLKLLLNLKLTEDTKDDSTWREVWSAGEGLYWQASAATPFLAI